MTSNEFLRDGVYFNDVRHVLPEGTEVFIGITLVLDGGEWKQKFSFSKVQNLGKAKAKPKYNTAQVDKMKEQKQLADEFNKIELVDDDF